MKDEADIHFELAGKLMQLRDKPFEYGLNIKPGLFHRIEIYPELLEIRMLDTNSYYANFLFGQNFEPVKVKKRGRQNAEPSPAKDVEIKLPTANELPFFLLASLAGVEKIRLRECTDELFSLSRHGYCRQLSQHMPYNQTSPYGQSSVYLSFKFDADNSGLQNLENLMKYLSAQTTLIRETMQGITRQRKDWKVIAKKSEFDGRGLA